jgi:hypothetical protein
MQRVDLYLKIELELDDKDAPAKLAGEICRQIAKQYGVRRAEIQNVVEKD